MGRLFRLEHVRLAAILVAATLLCTCGKSGPKPEVRYGVAFNDVRRAKGIPILEPSWKLERATNDTLSWNPVVPTPLGVAAYAGKNTVYSGTGATREEDWYSDGHTYDWIDPDRPTEHRNCFIIITFDFRKSKDGVNPWTYGYNAGDGLKELTEQQAEDKLKAAGLKRLNY